MDDNDFVHDKVNNRAVDDHDIKTKLHGAPFTNMV